MLHGPLRWKILVFAVPLMLSGILQQSFNAVDVAVVGRFNSPQAMAAVGCNGVIINILINLFLGVAIGANVVLANYLGQKNYAGVRRSVATVALISVGSGIILIAAGLLLSRPILEWMQTPADVIDKASQYLRIYFWGMPFIMIYNFGSAIMRSVGDTRRPFYALLAGAVTNLLLDLAFVGGLGMSVDGVAIATVIANAVDAAIITIMLCKAPEPIRLDFSRLGISKPDLYKMLKIGLPAGLQGMVFSVSNIFIQSAINAFGSAAVAGTAACITFESYCYYIVASMGAAAIAFTGQNYGAGLYTRCRKVWADCMLLGVLLTAAANVLIAWQAPAFVKIFTSDPQVLSFATERIHIVLAFQFIACSYEISGAYMRGLGWSATPMILTLLGTCVLRLCWVFYLQRIPHTFGTLLWIYPITWVVTGILVVAAAFWVQRKVFKTGI